MDALLYKVSGRCYPRHQYTLKIKNDITSRYNRLICKLYGTANEEVTEDVDDTSIYIYLCKSSEHGESFPAIENVVLRAADKTQSLVQKKQVSTITDIFKADSDVLHGKLLFVITEKNIIDVHPNAFQGYIIYIAKCPKEVANLQKCKRNNEDVCLAEDVGQTICNILERHALAGTKTKCEDLDAILSNFEKKATTTDNIDDLTTKLAVSKMPRSSPLTIRSASFENTGQEKSVFFEMSPLVKSYSETAIRVRSKQKELKTSTFNRRFRNFPLKQKVEENRETIERLIGEIIGVFSRSNVPKDQHPQVNNGVAETVKEELLLELKKISPKIRNCGYRFSTLQIYAESEGEADKEKLKAAIKPVLDKYKIKKFSLVLEKIDEFCTCCSGNKVHVKYKDDNCISGTLGGFVQTSSEESERKWAMMSRHVAKYSKDRNVYISNSPKPVVARIMKEIKEEKDDKEYLDIAVAQVEKRDEEYTDNSYITEDRKPVRGTLCDFNMMEKFQGLPVHIHGAVTPLGLGTITVPNRSAVQSNDVGVNYIVVEERDKEQCIPFCKSGDSGAVVCAESPDNYGEEVQLISMVMGENLGQKGTYTTVRLDKGLEQLNELTGKTFNPC